VGSFHIESPPKIGKISPHPLRFSWKLVFGDIGAKFSRRVNFKVTCPTWPNSRSKGPHYLPYSYALWNYLCRNIYFINIEPIGYWDMVIRILAAMYILGYISETAGRISKSRNMIILSPNNFQQNRRGWGDIHWVIWHGMTLVWWLYFKACD